MDNKTLTKLPRRRLTKASRQERSLIGEVREKYY